MFFVWFWVYFAGQAQRIRCESRTVELVQSLEFVRWRPYCWTLPALCEGSIDCMSRYGTLVRIFLCFFADAVVVEPLQSRATTSSAARYFFLSLFLCVVYFANYTPVNFERASQHVVASKQAEHFVFGR